MSRRDGGRSANAQGRLGPSLADLAGEIEWAKARMIAPEAYPDALVATERRPPLPAHEMAALLAAMRKLGKTIFVVTHQPALLESVADEFVWMEAGKIIKRTSTLRAEVQ